MSARPLTETRGEIAAAVAASGPGSGLRSPLEKATLPLQPLSAASLRVAIEGAGIAIWDCDIASGVVVLSPEWSVMLGGELVDTQTTQRELFDLVPDETQRQSLTVTLGEVLKGNQIRYDVEHQVRRRDGSTLWIRSRGAVTARDADGMASRVSGINIDISRERAAAVKIVQQQRLLQSVFDAAPVSIWVIDAQGRPEMVNRQFCTTFDVPEGRHEEVQHYRELFPVEAAIACAISDANALGSDVPVVAHELIPLADGTHEFEVIKARVVDESGGVRGLVGLAVDVTERHAMLERLRLMASVYEHSPEGIMIVDDGQRIVEVNRRFTQITGYDAADVLGQSPDLLVPDGFDTDPCADIWETLRTIGYWSGERWKRRKDGTRYAEQSTIFRLPDVSGSQPCYVSIFTDLSSVHQSEMKLVQLAERDPVTDLPNLEVMRRYLADGAQLPTTALTVYFIDIDRFKAVNDRLGPDGGNEVLVRVAQRLRTVVDDTDLLAHLGADEFALASHAADANAKADALINCFRQPFALTGGLVVPPTASVGLVTHANGPIEVDRLVRLANMAVYTAKIRGGNNWQPFDAEGEERLRLRHQRRRDIIDAIARDELVLHFQPQVDMRNGAIVGFEALVRWQHPQAGLLMPGQFLPDVSEGPEAVTLDMWVIRQVLVQLRQWETTHPDWRISANLSPYTFTHGDLVNRLRNKIARIGPLRPGCLELEIVESAAIANIDSARATIDQLRAMNIVVSIDDFGVGYASLSYLRQLACGRLKIDRSFIDQILDDTSDISLVSGVISLARIFKHDVIAEGVETAEQGILLMRLGCHFAQGWGIARAMDVHAIDGWIQQWSPDPGWSRWGGIDWDMNDLPLIVALRDHQTWLEQLLASAERPVADEARAPLCDHRQCRFGNWLYQRLDQSTGHPDLSGALRATEDEHRRLHQCVGDLLQAIDTGQAGRAAQLRARLLLHGASWPDSINRLQVALAATHSTPQA